MSDQIEDLLFKAVGPSMSWRRPARSRHESDPDRFTPRGRDRKPGARCFLTGALSETCRCHEHGGKEQS
ncbi:MAG: hypothetical protein ACRD0Q_00640 [Acidimicrobiales bacterium]